MRFNYLAIGFWKNHLGGTFVFSRETNHCDIENVVDFLTREGNQYIDELDTVLLLESRIDQAPKVVHSWHAANGDFDDLLEDPGMSMNKLCDAEDDSAGTFIVDDMQHMPKEPIPVKFPKQCPRCNSTTQATALSPPDVGVAYGCTKCPWPNNVILNWRM